MGRADPHSGAPPVVSRGGAGHLHRTRNHERPSTTAPFSGCGGGPPVSRAAADREDALQIALGNLTPRRGPRRSGDPVTVAPAAVKKLVLKVERPVPFEWRREARHDCGHRQCVPNRDGCLPGAYFRRHRPIQRSRSSPDQPPGIHGVARESKRVPAPRCLRCCRAPGTALGARGDADERPVQPRRRRPSPGSTSERLLVPGAPRCRSAHAGRWCLWGYGVKRCIRLRWRKTSSDCRAPFGRATHPIH